MSANQWGGLLLRTQSRRCVDVVSKLLAENELFTEVTHLHFSALGRTKLTWVSFTPFDDFDDADTLLNEGRAIVAKIARALRTEVWVVVNNDYSGVEYLSFDAQGRKRWKAHENRKWSWRINERVEKALEKAKTSAARRAVEATRKPLLAAARAKTPLGRLEAEAGLEWDGFINLYGEAKRTAWRKKVRVGKPAPRPVASNHAIVADTPTPVDKFNVWRVGWLRELLADKTRTMVELRLPVTTFERIYEASVARTVSPDSLIDSLFEAAKVASLVVQARDPAAPAEERNISISSGSAKKLASIVRARGVPSSDVVDTLARAL